GIVTLNLGGRIGYAIGVPIHELTLRVQGPAVADIQATFLLHWNEALRQAGKPIVPASVGPAVSAGNVDVQVVRTIRGGNYFAGSPHGETGVLEAYLRAIAMANTYIYLENQYFTS